VRRIYLLPLINRMVQPQARSKAGGAFVLNPSFCLHGSNYEWETHVLTTWNGRVVEKDSFHYYQTQFSLAGATIAFPSDDDRSMAQPTVSSLQYPCRFMPRRIAGPSTYP